MTNLMNAAGFRQDQHLSTTTMAPKTHRAGGGLARTHSRTSSGGGSRVGLSELRLTTTKEAATRYPDKPKKSTHHFETNARNNSHLSRTNSTVRVQPKEPVNPQPRRTSTPLNNKSSSAKQKPGFTISSPSEEADDDEWMSSESGAATPNHESDVEELVTPVERSKPKLPPNVITHGFAKDEHPTPRAEPAALPRINTITAVGGPEYQPPVTSRDYAPPQTQHTALPQPQAVVTAATPQQTPVVRSASPPSPPPLAHVPKARSETHSPPRRSLEQPKRSVTRPPSTHSIASSSTHPLRPHPLIRAHSVSHGALPGSAKPVPLAPLTSSEQIPAQIPTSSPTSYRAVSPTFSMQTATASPVLSQPSPTDSQASRQLRRTSTGSRSSTTTLPAGAPLHGSASHAQLERTSNHDRQRTLSSSSTFAALSSLNLGMRATPSPSKTPLQHLTVFFPPAERQDAQLEHVHPLLPPPYINAHLTILAYRSPLSESYERVTRAKKAR
ncbi:hypothetical protein PHLGIDRAFT_130435 [Phlebiopsis gigantea 11061_1 CR5-6]|uniref:Uncharacterized protein n=1 Tax=Phlebiopsis gigantea (strain 11061_1 CR5-6) TaxID=745531 RepID=A0A0C3NEB2_PHLG1|nr:hypothetical protein PHLGIDRAFT_130435 [Phlebiopsis gigantea 11061_1 CR5-6]